MLKFFKNSLSVLDEFVFENRNKAYGAYELRKLYGSYSIKALFFACLFLVLITLSIFIFYNVSFSNATVINDVDFKTIEYSAEEIIIPKIIQEKKSMGNEEKKPTPVEPDLNNTITKEDAIVSDEKVKKSEETKSEKPAEKGKGTDNKNQEDSPKSVSQDTSGTELYTDEIFMKVETNAEFPGGKEAFEKFIETNIQFPEYAVNNKIDGIVYVHMVVSKQGVISELKIYRGIEQSCNEEILRILKLSPTWIPARIRGKNVRQRIILPVKFKVK